MASADMGGTDIAFFTAVATAIPVFVVAYAVGVNKLISESLRPRADSSMRTYLWRLAQAPIDAGSRGSVFRVLRAAMPTGGWDLVQGVLFVIAVVLPGVGEATALYALYANDASPTTRLWSLLGALTAGLVVLAPLAFAALRSISSFLIW